MFGSVNGNNHPVPAQSDALHDNNGRPPLTGAEVIALYENLSTLSRQMVCSARRQDWNRLARLEQDCASRLDALKDGHSSLSGEMRVKKVRLLQGILADDREIRTITESWIDQVPRLMHG